jgi:hypothetical protein
MSPFVSGQRLRRGAGSGTECTVASQKDTKQIACQFSSLMGLSNKTMPLPHPLAAKVSGVAAISDGSRHI